MTVRRTTRPNRPRRPARRSSVSAPTPGKGAAIRIGFRDALERGAVAVVTLDADGQHDPAEIPAFLSAFEAGRPELIIGRRDFGSMPPVRRLSNTLGGWVFSAAVGRRVADNQSGYRLIGRRLMTALLDSDEQGFEFEVEMIARCIALGLPMAEVPIRTIYAGEPSHIRPWAHFTSFLRVSRDARRIVRGVADDRTTRRSVASDRGARWPVGPLSIRRAGRRCPVRRRRRPGARSAVVVAVLERVAGFDNGSPAFLLAVVVVAVLRGTGPAIATAIGSFLRLRLPVHRACLHAHGPRPGRVAEPHPAARRRGRGRAPGRARARPGRRRDRRRARGARAVRRQLHARRPRRDMAAALAAIARLLSDEVTPSRVWMMVGDAIVRRHVRRSAARSPRNPAVHATLRRRPRR